MNENFDYKFEKNYSRIETSVLKLKDAQKIQQLISTGRLKNFIEFESYGIITYDENDERMLYPYVTKMDKFNRLRTNVIIYNVRHNDWNQGVYDKLYIIKQNNVKEPTFAYIFHNLKTGQCSMMPAIEYAYDRLIQNITKSINIIKKHKLLDYYSRKTESAHSNNPANIPTDKEGQAIIKEYYNHVLENVKS